MPRFCASACFLWVLVETGSGLLHTKSATWDPQSNQSPGLGPQVADHSHYTRDLKWEPGSNHTPGVSRKVADNNYPRNITREEFPAIKKLLYIHLEKTGGSFMGQVLKNAVGKENHFGYHDGQPIEYIPDNYFVVTSVRNPCTRAYSAWSYSCQKNWLFLELGIDDACVSQVWLDRVKNGECPTFHGTSETNITVSEYNVQAFHDRFIKRGDSFDKPFLKAFSLLTGGQKRVNCIVRYEHLDDDTRMCLKKYEQFRGDGFEVDWDTFERAWGRVRKNEGHHGACKAYYEDPKLEQIILDKNPLMAEEFGYTSCCGDSIDWKRDSESLGDVPIL